MITIGIIVVAAIFLVVGWAVTTEMLQQRAWRRRVASGDLAIIAALIEEALATWRRARPPRGIPPSTWAGIQSAQLVAVEADSATLSASAEGEFATVEGRRVQVTSALDAAIAIAAKLLDMMLYDVPNLRLGTVRVDVYTTFTSPDGTPDQRPILTVTADRAVAEDLPWDALTPAEILGRFEAHYEPDPAGRPVPIELPPVSGTLPRLPGQGAPSEPSRE
ncbi:hypothetical protein [Tepidiforma sp.]|uniref:hypothetical protein n=1 Tax=Tepidiforma sp. TaxID=2682230 RepID=UPI002ADDD44B|nr:hypothetical protein [Tepidiforma sp.]